MVKLNLMLKDKILQEGTWGRGFKKKENVTKAIKELELWKDKWYHDLGDDEVFNGIDQAIEALKSVYMRLV